MLNAVEPGTVVPIHRHPTKDESFVILRGKVRVTTHNDDGSIIEDVMLGQEGGNYGVDIPKNVWHKLKESGGQELSYTHYTPIYTIYSLRSRYLGVAYIEKRFSITSSISESGGQELSYTHYTPINKGGRGTGTCPNLKKAKSKRVSTEGDEGDGGQAPVPSLKISILHNYSLIAA